MSALIVAGCGLLGTSVARAYQRACPEGLIVGVEPNSSAQAAAAGLGVYSAVVDDIDAAVSKVQTEAVAALEQEVIGIAATPPAMLADTLLTLGRHCSLTMDVGSIKAPVAARLDSVDGVPPSIVPCHPMAGSHHQGPIAASAELFDGRWVFVVPQSTSDADCIKRAHEFWQSLGASTQEITPAAHDEAVAYTSHLPHLLASTYMGVQTPLSAAAGTGFLEFTRLAKANPEMWSQVLMANKAGWQPVLRQYIDALETVEALIEAGDVSAVESWLQARLNERTALDVGAN